MNIPTQDMMAKAEFKALFTPGLETCGVMVYPDRRFALGHEKPTVPRFVPVPNVAEDPTVGFQFDFEALQRAVGFEYGGHPAGFIQLWHSHPRPAGPSPEDFAQVETFEQDMAKHPVWGVTKEHLIFSMPDRRWWAYSATVAEDLGYVTTNQGA